MRLNGSGAYVSRVLKGSIWGLPEASEELQSATIAEQVLESLVAEGDSPVGEIVVPP